MGQGKHPQVLLRYAAVSCPHPQGRGELRHHRLLFKRQRTVCGKEVHAVPARKAGLAGAFRQGHQHHTAFGTAGRSADLTCMDLSTKKQGNMKGTEHFKEIIKGYLDQKAKEDELFRAKYETTARTMDDVVAFILNEVQKSGCCGFADDEIYSMAVHCIDEPELEIGKPQSCNVVVNHHVELTEEEKAEQRALALKRYQDEELRMLQARNHKPKPAKAQEDKQHQPSLFDNF